MATLKIALGQARVDPPLVNCVAAAADKTEAQTSPGKEADFLLFSDEFDAFSSQQSAPTDLPPEENTRLIKKRGVLIWERLPALQHPSLVGLFSASEQNGEKHLQPLMCQNVSCSENALCITCAVRPELVYHL